MKTFKQFLSEANNKDKYTILNDYNSKNKRYWYIVDKKGDPIYDDDGNDIHFNSFNKAKEYVDEYLTEAKQLKEDSSKYKPGEFGYMWTIELGFGDIEGEVYKGNIRCNGDNLTSLKGCPKEVTGDFECQENKLTSLEYSPEKVDGNFDCTGNKLTSLKGCPKEVGGEFACCFNRLKTLDELPKKLTSLILNGNSLKSLKGCPKEVKGDFGCRFNQLTSLECAPQIVGNRFDCTGNKLTSLEGCPQKVGGSFNCSRNKKVFKKNEGPKELGGSFINKE